MLALSRLRTLSKVLQRSDVRQITPVRHGGAWVYRRAGPPAPKHIIYIANSMGFILWYWILYKCWHEPEHLVGHYPYPDSKKWTDEELGIPPDEEG